MSIGKYNSDGNIYSVAEANEKFSSGGGDVGELTTRVENLETDNTKNKSDISALESDVATIQTEISTLQSGVEGLTERVTTNENDIATTETEISTLQSGVEGLTERVTTNENDISALENEVSDLILGDSAKTIFGRYRVSGDIIGNRKSLYIQLTLPIYFTSSDISSRLNVSDINISNIYIRGVNGLICNGASLSEIGIYINSVGASTDGLTNILGFEFKDFTTAPGVSNVVANTPVQFIASFEINFSAI